MASGSVSNATRPGRPQRSANAVRAGRAERAGAIIRHPITLWSAFLLVHLVLGYLCLNADGLPLGDVTLVYKPWALQAQSGMAIVGLDVPWVYPPLALIPILLPLIVGQDQYAGGWLAMVLILDAVAFAVLTVRRGHRATSAAWWWLAFLLLLGPIAVARLDAVSVAIVIVALLWLRSRPRVAAVLLAVATWIKVWPVAAIAAVFVVSRDRWRMLLAVASTSVVIVILGLTFGNGVNVFSFVTQQTGRGLQIEAPISAPWMWAAALHSPGSFVYYDRALLTFQVAGPNIDTAIALMTPLLVAMVVLVLLVGAWATYSGVPSLTVLPLLMLGLVATLIAFNKVGSPQYITWFAAPVILGIVCAGRAFRTPAILVAVTAALTQLVYPYLYIWLLNVDVVMVAILTVRNVMLFVILLWSLWALWHSVRVAGEAAADTAAEAAAEIAAHEGGHDASAEAASWPYPAVTDRKD
ncbi:glycosyltransferase 87 family protein [Rathayibacter soli]|uniref:glycosyltransferase 87 family protein n=1 Tax=Rathayibacter soli TaxID=3144168 RepID=UPI0027E4B9B8|nr:glycosyltransferase 87 family protein [Glaciibacter superstes]